MVRNNTRGFGSPSRYFQGPGELNNIIGLTSLYGTRVFMLIDVVFFDRLTNNFTDQYEKNSQSLLTDLFGGEITDQEIERVSQKAAAFKPNVVVGIGGGKTLDTIKAVADDLHLPVIIVPTTASTDAPCSAMSIIYNPDGTHNHERIYIKNPDIVLVDSEIIAKAPIRFLVAGMGDALSTFFEARANSLSDSANYVNLGHGGGYRRTRTAMEISKLCYEILLMDGLKAKHDAELGVCSEALENVIEANTLLSGVGFENVGCAGAHSLNYAIAAVPGGTKPLHGEKVAYGVIVQLVAEDSPMSELDEVIRFCLSVGLPVTLEDMQIEASPENIELIAKTSMGPLWQSEPFNVNWQMVRDAIIKANNLGHDFKNRLNIKGKL